LEIKSIRIKNFRKILNEVNLDMNEEVLIVGKNNTGKTSIFELFRKFLTSGVNFQFEDFNNNSVTKQKINKIYEDYRILKEHEDEQQRNDLINSLNVDFPQVILDIVISTSAEDNLAMIRDILFEFDKNHEIILSCRFEVTNIQNLMKGFEEYNEKVRNSGGLQSLEFYDYLKRELHNYYSINYYSTKEQSEGDYPVESNFVKNLFNIGIINAQREVDDTLEHSKQNISNAVWYFYQNIIKDVEDIHHEDTYRQSITYIRDSLNESYKDIFKQLITEVNENILSSNSKHQIEISSEININDILKNNSKVKYTLEEHVLPEAYNGLGYSNMLFIFIQIITYKYKVNKENKLFNLLFIEEPESHLHPQMQSTFLRKIEGILENDNKVYRVITTHSSYILQNANVLSIRYFLDNGEISSIKNLSSFFQDERFSNLKTFIQQYFKINTCDLFFADKALLVEGNVERMLMPILIEKFDNVEGSNLSKQHLTTIEVGGAYAHLFYELLDFLEIKSLIITDIDSVSGSHNNKCKCDISQEANELSELTIKTSNAVIKNWFGKTGEKFYIKDLIDNYYSNENLIKTSASDEEKEARMITFQTPIEGKLLWGRTFEEQFIIENGEILISYIEKGDLKSLSEPIRKAGLDLRNLSVDIISENAFEIVSKIEKTNFALELLEFEGWYLPKYIVEGFKWLER
jgi:putative ATP-dependent endonuclease of the OLD family